MKNCYLLLFMALMFPYGAIAERAEFSFECTPFDERAISGPVWNASTLDIMSGEGYGFISQNSKGFITEYIGTDAEHYILRGDSLIFRGYTRGRSVGALVDSLVPILQFPLETGASAMSAYTVSGYVDGLSVFHDYGTVYGKVVREGVFIFAPEDTVSAVLVHERRSCSTNIRDSIINNTDDFWRWYTPDSRLPFALQFKRSEERCARLFLTDRFQGHEVKSKAIQTDNDVRQRIIDCAEVSVSEFEVSVILGNAPDIEAEVYIIDVAGNIYGHTVRMLDSEANEFHISLSGIQRKGCMLVMTLSGNPPVTNKRLLQI